MKASRVAAGVGHLPDDLAQARDVARRVRRWAARMAVACSMTSRASMASASSVGAHRRGDPGREAQRRLGLVGDEGALAGARCARGPPAASSASASRATAMLTPKLAARSRWWGRLRRRRGTCRSRSARAGGVATCSGRERRLRRLERPLTLLGTAGSVAHRAPERQKFELRSGPGGRRSPHRRRRGRLPTWARARSISTCGTCPCCPERRDYPIGIIGAGFIVADVQIPAYQAAGYNVAAIASRTPATRARSPSGTASPTVHDTWRELLDDERIEVVDIAFPPDQQLEIVAGGLPAAPHIKGILAQKPLAAELRARPCSLVAGVRRRRQGCSPSTRTCATTSRCARSRRCSTAATSASRCSATIEMRAIPHWQTFLEGTDRLTLREHVDPPPRRRSATSSATPRASSSARAPTRARRSSTATASASTSSSTRTACARAPGTTSGRARCARAPRATSTSSGASRAPRASPGARSAGRSIPTPTPEHAALHDQRSSPGCVLQPRWTEVWFPDAFAGTMGALFDALDGGENVLLGRRQPGARWR